MNLKLLACLFLVLIATTHQAMADKYDKKLYKPTSADVTRFATLPQLKQGREIYINRCTKCHGLVSPDRYIVNDWGIIVSKMSPRAGLTRQESVLLYKYVTRGN